MRGDTSLGVFIESIAMVSLLTHFWLKFIEIFGKSRILAIVSKYHKYCPKVEKMAGVEKTQCFSKQKYMAC